MKPGAKDVWDGGVGSADCFPGVWVSFSVPPSPVLAASPYYLEREMAPVGPLPWLCPPLQSQHLWSPLAWNSRCETSQTPGHSVQGRCSKLPAGQVSWKAQSSSQQPCVHELTPRPPLPQAGPQGGSWMDRGRGVRPQLSLPPPEERPPRDWASVSHPEKQM